LTWIPWVGDNYESSEKKILVVGESHYYDPYFKNDSSFKEHKRLDYTQHIVNAIGVGLEREKRDKRHATMYENFYRSIRFENQKREDFWHSVSFYNFIQQPMHSRKQRPNNKMIAKAWNSFKSVVDILKPDVVIFIGVKCCDGFNEFVMDKGSLLKVETKISNKQIPRSASVIANSKELPIHFIKHSSSFYSGDKWRKYFEAKNII